MVVVTRGNNGLVKDCDCEEYERPAEDEKRDCSYYGCTQAKHKRDNQNDSNNGDIS